MNHPLELLETFVAAAEELHFATAAERLHLDPSSVSRRVRQLESSTGITLFDRSTRRVALTDAGRTLLPVVRSALERLDDVEEMIRSLRRAERATISVGVVANSANALLLERLATAAIDLDVEVETTLFQFDDPSAGVRDTISDLGIIFDPIDSDGLMIQRLFSVPRVAILPAGHRLTSRDELSISDIVGEPWIKPSNTDRAFLDHWLAVDYRNGCEPLVGAIAHTAVAGLLAIMSGKGISVGVTTRIGPRSDGLVTVPITDLPPTDIAVVTRTDAEGTPARALAERLHRFYATGPRP